MYIRFMAVCSSAALLHFLFLFLNDLLYILVSVTGFPFPFFFCVKNSDIPFFFLIEMQI